MPERDRVIAAFLNAGGWGGARRERLAGDASFRRYERLNDGGRRAVLMDAPPPHEDVRPFASISRLLKGLGYSAPEVLAEDPAAGLLVLEDFGDETFTRALERAAEGGILDEFKLYALAVDFLVDLHRRPARETLPAGLPAYDEARLLDEAVLLTDWYLPAVTGSETDAASRDAYMDAWRQCLAPVLEAAPTLVLRDFHVDNLMRLPGRDGVAACGLLDFQDAVAGHRAYDLMSLLEDARRDIAAGLRHGMMARYLEAFPELAGPDAAGERFRDDFAILAAQRHAKVIGIFTRLCVRDAKPDYLVHIPRVWNLLERALAERALAPVADWMKINLPAGSRTVPKVDAKMET